MKILDTDTCVELLRGNQAVIARRAGVDDDVATTCITAAELYYGAAKSRDPTGNQALVDHFLETLEVLELAPAACPIFGEAKALLERKGTRWPTRTCSSPRSREAPRS